MIRFSTFLFFLIVLFSCSDSSEINVQKAVNPSIESNALDQTSIVILGTTQDAGSPQIGCVKKCCTSLKGNEKRMVSALGIIEPSSNKKYLIDATPDIENQINILNEYSSSKDLPDGVFLTHAHIGHYTGLMYLGKEGANSQGIKVHVMSRMKKFIESNGPWNQLVENQNIRLNNLNTRDTVKLSAKLKIIPFIVPHRDEYSETVGYKIIGPNRSALFIPDIDKWDKWNSNIVHEISMVDFAFIDGTFYDGAEISHRDISEIPHPFIIESMNALRNISQQEKNKVYFIHFNHTNPALNENSNAYLSIMKNGFHVAKAKEVFPL